MVPVVPPLGKKKKKKLSEGQKLSLLVNQIIFKISFSIYFSLVDNKWRREESWDLHLHVITCFAFHTTQRIPIRLFSRQWCWRFLGSRWIRFKLSSSRLFIFFFFCPSSSLEQWGLQCSPPSRGTVQALPGSLLALPLTEQLYLALLNSLHIF